MPAKLSVKSRCVNVTNLAFIRKGAFPRLETGPCGDSRRSSPNRLTLKKTGEGMRILQTRHSELFPIKSGAFFTEGVTKLALFTTILSKKKKNLYLGQSGYTKRILFNFIKKTMQKNAVSSPIQVTLCT